MFNQLFVIVQWTFIHWSWNRIFSLKSAATEIDPSLVSVILRSSVRIKYQIVEPNYDEDGSEGAADAGAVRRAVGVHLGDCQVLEIHPSGMTNSLIAAVM